MAEGYLDGCDPDAPEPSANRSHSYRHGFAVRRAEITTGNPLAHADALRCMADKAMKADDNA